LFRTDRAILSGRALHSKDRRDYPHLGVRPDDLYIQFEPWPRIGRPPKHDVAAWTVADHWPRRVPVTEAEVDVFEAGLRQVDWEAWFWNSGSIQAVPGNSGASGTVRLTNLEWTTG
jgi:hypothetical protein